MCWYFYNPPYVINYNHQRDKVFKKEELTMKGLLDNMFDFDHDGKLGFFERASKRQFINNMM